MTIANDPRPGILDPAGGAVGADVAPALSRRLVAPWLRRGAWAFADQTLFALSNFLLNVALARLLRPSDFGTFTIGYTIFLLVGTVYTSFLIEPLLVFGAGVYRDDLRTYVRALVRYHWRGTAITSVVLFAAGAVTLAVAHRELGHTLIALAVANPCILLQWLMRRACFVRFEPRLAAIAGVWYVAALLAGGGLLYSVGWLTAATGVLLMGVGSLVSALWLTARLDIRPFTVGRDTVLPGLLAEHWRYGRWVILSGIFGWVPQSLFYLLLPLRGGLASTAALKALMNLTMPPLHAYMPLLVLMVPALVRVRGTPGFRRTVGIALAFSLTCSGLYWLVLGAFGRELVGWLYKGQYLSEAPLLWIIGGLPFTGAAVAVFGSALRSLERSKEIFRAYAVSALVAVALGTPLMLRWGITGAAIGIVLSSLATVLTMAWGLARPGRPDGVASGAGIPSVVGDQP